MLTQVYYSSATDYWKPFMSGFEKPLTVITKDDVESNNYYVLDDIHQHLLEYHADLLKEANVDPSSLPTPSVVRI